MSISREDHERLGEIIGEIKELSEEFKSIVKRAGDKSIADRFLAYEYAGLTTALDNEHNYVGDMPANFQETADDLKVHIKDEDEDEFEQENENDDSLSLL